jgi:hypothetical protein
VDSVNFRSFGWVLVRECYLAAIVGAREASELDAVARRFVSHLPTSEVRRRLLLFLDRHPERRIV